MREEFPTVPVDAPEDGAGASQPECLETGTGYSVVAVTGEEAGDFLQRILTADIPAADDARSVLAGLCTPKGRLLALARVIPWDDGYRLVLPEDTAAETVARLQMYVLRSRVTVHAPDMQWRLLRAAGPTARSLLARWSERPMPEAEGVVRSGEVAIIRLPGAPERYWVVGPAAPVAAVEGVLAEHLPPTDEETWRALEILAGQPEIRAPGRELFIPQMVNLDRLGGVSFSKGCFPGQEVVARAHYRGKVKQRMFRARGTGDAPADGSEVRDADNQLAGHVVCAAGAPQGFTALVSLREAQLSGPASLSVNGQPLHLLREAGT
ncbi:MULTISPECIES: CAF17-like 4Fe-4S cluster assembly/insertion protein YgfZ [unclassified Halorhodospira]|uniref:CAF17-like 4Fe-4S cluster assembly/insertion protein YgfZ n=1 Tax=unclassified Halorhodospira TaxID=2626748 RepID=UPI001EE8D783|nr:MULTISPECIES: hypothetical protein [unclassified Halorhodospira]MCG5539770.1 hypothetical protein [Halorhodospira sp. M39old]MCG5544780.1 hypothetical protein [Halorhodospira sp. M38]